MFAQQLSPDDKICMLGGAIMVVLAFGSLFISMVLSAIREKQRLQRPEHWQVEKIRRKAAVEAARAQLQQFTQPELEGDLP